MMKNYYESVEMNCNSNWPYIPDHLLESQLLKVQYPIKLMYY